MDSTQRAPNAHHRRRRHYHDRDRRPPVSISLFLFAGLMLTIFAFLAAIERAPIHAEMQQAARAGAATSGVPVAAPARR